jgi:arylsulfatase B
MTSNLTRRLLLGSLPAALAGSALAANPSKPNVLIFLADDLGWNDVGYHGSEVRTPNIDRLASEGIKLERAYSCPVCSPTRCGLMTGRSPVRLGLGNTVIRPWSDFGVPLRERFLPQAFKDAGYQTGMAGKWHLGHSRRAFLPISRGFDQTYGHVNGAIDYFHHDREGGLDWARNGKSVVEEGYSTSLLGNDAVRFIKQRDRNRPFFFYLPFNSPHAPLQAPAEYLDKYASISDQRRRTFAAMVSAMDDSIGRVLSTLKDEGLAENTLVLFFSDNGGPVALGANNMPFRGAKASTFEGGTRVPTVMRWPGRIKAGSKSEQVISVIDYFPTLTSAAGIAPGNTLPFDGLNVWTSISGGKISARENLFLSVESAGAFRTSLRHREWKLVREVPRGGEARSYLFHIEEDPTEKNDLSAKNPKVAAELLALTEKWQALQPSDAVRASEGPPAGWQAPKQWAEAARES